MATYQLLAAPGSFGITGFYGESDTFDQPPAPVVFTVQTPSRNQYIQTTYPWFWTFDYTGFTFDSTDTQWTFDGGQVRGGAIVTRNDKNPHATSFNRLSVTRTENLRF